jgi:hypothetical protein
MPASPHHPRWRNRDCDYNHNQPLMRWRGVCPKTAVSAFASLLPRRSALDPASSHPPRRYCGRRDHCSPTFSSAIPGTATANRSNGASSSGSGAPTSAGVLQRSMVPFLSVVLYAFVAERAAGFTVNAMSPPTPALNRPRARTSADHASLADPAQPGISARTTGRDEETSPYAPGTQP